VNPFTTEHPLASTPSWFDRREHPVISFVCRTFIWALILTPLILWCLYTFGISDIGTEPDPFPDPWRDLFAICLIAFVLSLVFAFLLVLFYRLFGLKFGSSYVRR
jgi:vacuolar-type H+-ATPase subunit I/STV1